MQYPLDTLRDGTACSRSASPALDGVTTRRRTIKKDVPCGTLPPRQTFPAGIIHFMSDMFRYTVLYELIIKMHPLSQWSKTGQDVSLQKS